MKPHHIYISCSVGLLALTQSMAANAQTSPTEQGTTQDDQSYSGISEIVVTARRREESQQSVPVTITTVTAEELERAGLRSTEDLRTTVPSLNIGGNRRDEAQFYIRGQGPGVQTTGQRNFSSVATYFAEVPTTVAGPGVFYDLQNVQVLKGPQGTLFGRNTTGGAVLFEPHHPTFENSGYAKVTLGNYDYKEFEGVVNVTPVPDKVAIRLAAQISRRDGYTTSAIGQDLDERDYEAFRASFQINPTDSINSLTIFDYRAKDGNGGSAIIRAINPDTPFGAIPQNSPQVAAAAGVPVGTVIPLRLGGTVSVGCLSATAASAAALGCPAPIFGSFALGAYAAAYNGGDLASAGNSGFAFIAPTSTLNATLAAQQMLGPRRTQITDMLRSKSLDLGITNKTSIDVTDNITLKNIIAFRKSRKNESADYDGTPFDFLTNFNPTSQAWGVGSDQFTEEFQIQGLLPSANLSYIFGYYHELTKTPFLQAVPGNTLGSFSIRRATNKDVSDALFGHLEWNPTDWIGLSGGIRKTWDKRQASLSAFAMDGTTCLTDIVPACPTAGSAKFSATSYDATLNITPMDRVLLYASYRHGYKSGGINLPAPSPTATVFEPETVNSIEVGLKSDFDIGVPVRFNLAGFYDKYKNVQIQESVRIGSLSTSFVPSGINAVNKGFEAEMTIIPVPGFNLSGFFSYLDAAANDTVASTFNPGNIVIEGRQFSNQPKWKYGINGAVDLPIPESAGQAVLSANWSWQGKTNTTNTPSTLVTFNGVSADNNPSYGLLNARLEWNNIMQKNFDLAVFATNLTNETYVLGGYPIVQLGFDSVFYGEPRMYGASLTIHFGDH